MSIIFILLILFEALTALKQIDPDEYRNTIELITSKGYPAEEHPVTTKDGYILRVHRIPNGRNGNHKPNKPIVFLQHGLLDTSATWLLNMPDESLGYILADLGFDVWLGNMRGNTYSKSHVKYNPTEDIYWDFSFDEMAAYDLPAMVNYALNYTEQEQLIYVGHSQGTLIAFAQLDTDDDLSSKIKLFIGLGPVATVGHMNGLIHYIAKLGQSTNQEMLYFLFGKRGFFPTNKVIDFLADHFCDKKQFDEYFCKNIIFLICGPSKYLNVTRLNVYVTHTPAGTSVKNMAHFAQLSLSDKFQMYDYGSSKANLVHYNQTTAPVYSLTNIQVPVALYWARNDWLADPTDIQYLRNNLHNLVDDYEIQDWNHLDFIWATDARKDLYERMIRLIYKYV